MSFFAPPGRAVSRARLEGMTPLAIPTPLATRSALLYVLIYARIFLLIYLLIGALSVLTLVPSATPAA